ncbi:MAG: RNA polymerase sigma factor [Christensenellales bacterium]
MEVHIKINGQAVSVEVRIEVYEFLDCAKRKSENLHHEKRRHWDYREFDEYIVLTEGRNCYYQTPEQIYCSKETMLEILAALSLCTETQRKRFFLYALDDLSFAEIGRLEGCSKYAVRDSIEAVRKKCRDFFKKGPHETPFSG